MMQRRLVNVWTRLTLAIDFVKKERALSEASHLLPKDNGTEELPALYGLEHDVELGSGNDSQISNAPQTLDVEEKRPRAVYSSPDLCTDKWHLLHPQTRRLDLTSPESICAKYMLFLSNFGFSVLGLLILGIGVWGLIDKESLIQDKIPQLGSDPMLFVVLLGFVLSAVSLAGCMGALRENAYMLKFFTVSVVIFVVLQVLVGIMLYTLRTQIRDSLGGVMRLAISRYQDDADMKFIMDEIQLGLECCGEESYQDWKLNLYFNCSSPGANSCGVPFSCCIDPLQNGTVANSQCGFGALGAGEMLAQTYVYLGGCVPQLARWFSMNMGLIGSTAAIVLVLEVASLLLATRILGDIQLIKSQW